MKYSILLYGLFVLFLTSCDQNQKSTSNESSGHSHANEDILIQLTAYSNEYELFAETNAFVVGETSSVLAHFTNLVDFSPLENASVTISLIVDGEQIQQTLKKSLRKGIYKFKLKPQVKGKGKLIFDIASEGDNYQIEVPNIKVYGNTHDASHSVAAVDLSKTNTIVYTKEQSWKVDFATELPVNEPFGQVIKATAQIKSSQSDEILVSALSSGIVFFESNNILAGMQVEKDEVLVSISAKDLVDNNSQIRYNEAKNNYLNAKSNYDRLSALAEDKLVSEKDLMLAKNKLDNSKLIYDNYSKSFTSGGQGLRNPKDGFIKEVFVRNGEHVQAGQPIYTIAKGKTLLLSAQIQQKYAPLLENIYSANIHFLSPDKTFTLDELNGEVISFGKSTNNNNYLIPLSIKIDNNNDFVSGGFVEVYLKTLTNSEALTLPNTSLLEEQGNYFVFVQLTPELFEKREVFLAATDGIRTEIKRGISIDERVVTKGGFLIKLAQATGSLDAHSGHVH